VSGGVRTVVSADGKHVFVTTNSPGRLHKVAVATGGVAWSFAYVTESKTTTRGVERLTS